MVQTILSYLRQCQMSLKHLEKFQPLKSEALKYAVTTAQALHFMDILPVFEINKPTNQPKTHISIQVFQNFIAIVTKPFQT